MPPEMKRPYKFGGGALVASGVLFAVLDGLSWVAALYAIPGVPFVMDRVYRAIAERRYRLSCATAGCRGPASR